MGSIVQSTAVTVQARAALALGAAEHEKKLVELAQQSREIVAITNTAGYQQLHSARMALKRARIEIEKIGDEAREDARDFAKAVIAEQKRLIGIVEPEELRLQGIQDSHDAKVQAEKDAQARAEAERIAKIQAGIDEIKGLRVDAAGQPSAKIAALMDELEKRGDCAWAQEFQGAAESAKVATMNRLNEMHAAAMDQEAEAARLKSEREELERRRVEQDERERRERALVEEGMQRRLAEEKAARDRIEAEERASRLKIEQEERAARTRQEEADRAARAQREAEEAAAKAIRDEEEAKLREERERLEKERLAKEARIREALEKAEAKAKAKRDKEEAEERERLRKEAERMDARAMLKSFRERFGEAKEFSGVVREIDAYFESTPESRAKETA